MSKQPEEQRHKTRYALDKQILVKDQRTGKIIATLVDIHTEGMMLVGMIESDHVYMVSLEWEGQLPTEKIELGIDCIWSSGTEEGESCWAGCRVIDASAESIDAINHMISQFGSPKK